jgi:hypothetical protein
MKTLQRTAGTRGLLVFMLAGAAKTRAREAPSMGQQQQRQQQQQHVQPDASLEVT